MAVISIPKPCHEDWGKMLPAEQGRHCLQCCKTVVDFTDWEIPAILAYLQTRTQQGVCGRFTVKQLSPSIEQSKNKILQQALLSRLSLPRKVAAVIIILFGVTISSCGDQPIMGKASPPIETETRTMGEPAITTPPPVDSSYIKGKIARPAKSCTKGDSVKPDEKILMGDVVAIDTVPKE